MPLLRTTLVVAVLAWNLVACEPSAAQRPASPSASSGSVAILDLNYVFKKHDRFIALGEEMRREVEQADESVRQSKDAIKKLIDRLDDYRQGTQEYKDLEEEIAKRQSDLTLQVGITRKNFLEREAKNYYSVYREVLEHVGIYCEQNGITLVLRFNGDPANPEDPQAVLREINKQVIYYHKAIDITPIVLERVNSQRPGPRPGAAVGVRPRVGVPPKNN